MDRLKVALLNFAQEILDDLSRNNPIIAIFRGWIIDYVSKALDNPNLRDYAKRLYEILKAEFEGGK